MSQAQPVHNDPEDPGNAKKYVEEDQADRNNIISQVKSPVKDLVTGYEKIINISLSSSSSQKQEHLAPPPTKKEMTRKVQELGKLFEGGGEPDLGTERRKNMKPDKPPSKRKIWKNAELRPIWMESYFHKK